MEPDPAKSEGQDGLLYSEGKSWSGWWFVRKPDSKGKDGKRLDAIPVTCNP